MAGTIDRDFLRMLREQFALDWNGIHGRPHWVRVFANGERLAPLTRANPRVLELFAYLHDSRRLDDGYDPGHGSRAAAFARKMVGSFFDLDGEELQLLMTACRGHSGGLVTGDITVLTCWDADRLDLGRLGIRPRPERLCTDAARDPATIEWAFRRSRRALI